MVSWDFCIHPLDESINQAEVNESKIIFRSKIIQKELKDLNSN